MHQSALEMIVSEQTPNDVLSCNLLFIIPRLILSRHMHAGHGRIQRVTGFNSPKAFISVATVKNAKKYAQNQCVYVYSVFLFLCAYCSSIQISCLAICCPLFSGSVRVAV